MPGQLLKVFLCVLFPLIALDAQAAPFAYIADDGLSRVTVIDTATNTIVTNITGVGTVPEGVAVNPAGTRVYVTNSVTAGTVAVIDTATNTVIATIPVGPDPFGVAVNPAGTRAYVANADNTVGSISVIDTATNTVSATITSPARVTGVAIDPAGTRAYVSNDFAGSVEVIDTATNTIITTIPNAGLLGLAINPAGTRVYSAFGQSGKVIDTATNTVVATITFPVAGGSPQAVAINPAGTRAYYTDEINGRLYVVDTSTNTVIANIAVGNSPEGVSVTPDGLHVYVANSFSASVSVIDTATNTVVATIPTGAGSAPFAIGNFIGGPSAPPPGPGTLQFSSATYSVNESGGTATITVTRVGGSTGAVGVTFATSDGTATAGSDYTANTGTLSWADGDVAAKTFTVAIIDDSTVEANETVNLTLSAPTGGATLGVPATAVLTIVDNDAPVAVATAIPTLGQWALLATMFLLVAGGIGRIRRR